MRRPPGTPFARPPMLPRTSIQVSPAALRLPMFRLRANPSVLQCPQAAPEWSDSK